MVKYTCTGASGQFVIAIKRRLFGQSCIHLYRAVRRVYLREECQESVCSQSEC